MIFLFFFEIYSWVDNNGAIYDSFNRERLILVPGSLSDFVIPANTKIIAGGAQEESAFFECLGTKLSLTFEIGSQLYNIEPYGLGFLDVEILDLSHCTKLTVLGRGSLYGNKVKTIIFPPNLKEIKAGALCNMPNIIKFNFPSSLESTESFATADFPSSCGYNPKLTTVTFPNDSNLISLGSLTFARTALEVLSIPASLQSLSAQIIIYCPVSKIEVAEGSKTYSTDGQFLMNLDQSILYLCPSRIPGNITIPKTITMLDTGAFAGTIADTVILNDQIKTFSNDCFVHSTLKWINLPSSIISLGSRTFYNCTLTQINFQSHIQSIPREMFSSCVNLLEVIIPDSVTSIGKSAFSNCKRIKRIFIPKSVNQILQGAFTGINKDALIEFDNESQLSISEDVVYSADRRSLILYIGSSDSLEFVVPNTVEKIIGGAFSEVSFQSITFEHVSKVSIIEASAFYKSNIASISFPSSLLHINDFAFYSSKIETVEFNQGILTIGESAFRSNLLQSISLPSSLQTISASSFMDCTKLKDVTFLGESNVSSIGETAFANTNITNFRIPSSVQDISVSLFSKTPLQLLSFEGPSHIREIPSMAFKGSTKLLGVSFASGIEVIGYSAFEGCTSLGTIDLAKDIHQIGMYAFRNCSSLSRVNIPDDTRLNASGFGMFAFAGCTSLTDFSVSLFNQNFETEEGALYTKGKTQIVLYLTASSREHFVLPSNVLSISGYAFAGASNLISVSITSPGFESIGYGAFMDCTGITYFSIPESTIEVQPMAFSGCLSLGCGSVEFPQHLRKQLENSNIPSEALHPCPTVLFSAGTSYNSPVTPLLYAAVLKDD